MLEQHLVTLLIKLAVAASLASILLRFSTFQRTLMREQRTGKQQVQLALGCAAVYGASVAGRVLTRNRYLAMDQGLEGSLICGILGGYVTGLLGGIFISLPAMINGEFLSMPLYAGVGVLGGLLRDCAPDPEDIWRFSPFFDFGLTRIIREWRRVTRTAFFQLAFVVTIVLAEALRSLGVHLFGPKRLFALFTNPSERPDPLVPILLASVFTTFAAVVLPLKIWNNTRNERKLEAQQSLLNEARLAALMRQINPHFLFNTLNSIASLIRLNPDQARAVIYQLSRILRRLLKNHENLSPLRDELAFIEDYLAIEMVRFGDKLRYVKEIDSATLDCAVPSMLLQPIVENSIRHGLSTKVDGGVIRVSSRLANGKLALLIEDDGVGIQEARLATLFEQGIGVSNVNARLQVLYGGEYRMTVDSRPGEGTRTEISLPHAVKEPETAGLRPVA